MYGELKDAVGRVENFAGMVRVWLARQFFPFVLRIKYLLNILKLSKWNGKKTVQADLANLLKPNIYNKSCNNKILS